MSRPTSLQDALGLPVVSAAAAAVADFPPLFLFSPPFPLFRSHEYVLLSLLEFLCFVSILGCLVSALTLHVVVRTEMCVFQPESEPESFDGGLKRSSRFKTRCFRQLNLGPLCYQPSTRGRPTSVLLPSEVLDCCFFLLSDLVSALLVGGGWRAVGSGPDAGSQSAAETVDASLLCLKFSPPTLEEEPVGLGGCETAASISAFLPVFR